MILGDNYKKHKKLYLSCFTEDSESEAEFLFKTVLTKAECICEYEGEKPIAMLFLMESELVLRDKSLPFYYLYAAATDPAHRGKGLMRKLLAKAKDFAVSRGKVGIFLKPANPPLFDFYALSDFKPFFKVARFKANTDSIEKYNDNDLQVTNIPLDIWYTKRCKLLNNISDCYARFNPDLFIAATEGCSVAATKNAFAVYEKRDNLLLVKEAIFKNNGEKELLCLCCHLAKKVGAKKIEVRMPCACKLSGDIKSEIVDFSVIWQDGCGALNAKEPYHGFAFD